MCAFFEYGVFFESSDRKRYEKNASTKMETRAGMMKFHRLLIDKLMNLTYILTYNEDRN